MVDARVLYCSGPNCVCVTRGIMKLLFHKERGDRVGKRAEGVEIVYLGRLFHLLIEILGRRPWFLLSAAPHKPSKPQIFIKRLLIT